MTQNFIVSGKDNVPTGGNASGRVTHRVSSTDSEYNGISASSVSVIIWDDDAPPTPTAGVTVSKTSMTIAEDSGTDTYTVKLDSRPTGAVTIGVASDNTSVATVSPATLNFSTSNWSTAQTVTVTGVDDQVDSDRSTTVRHTVSGADYGSVTADPVMVNLTDDDAKGVTVSKTSLTIAEDGGTDTYTVKLNSQPTGTVTGVDDDVDSNRSTTVRHTVSGADYGSVTADSVSVNLTDDDDKGVTVSKTSLTIAEAAGSDTYTLVLDSRPTGAVTIGVASDNTSVATVSPTTLNFTTNNWSTAQTVTVTGVDDQVDSDRSTTIEHSVSGADYGGVTADPVSVQLTDDDAKGVTVSKTSMTIAEDSGTDTYTVKLDSRPTGAVTIGVASDDTSVATMSPATLNFTTGNWNTAQTVTVTGVDDQVDSDRSTTIQHTISGADYGSVSAASVSVMLTDDDAKGVTVSKTSMTIAEDGGTDTYTVKLNSQPTGTVTVAVASDDTTVATVQPASLMFTASTWSTAQTVTVTGVDDQVDSDRSTTVTHSVSGADYGSVSAAAVSVSLTDDDAKGVTVSKTSLTIAEDGGTDTYTVKLNSRPTGAVTIGVASDDTSVATVSPGTLNFTTGNWSTAQTVTVTGVDDDVDSNRSTTVRHTVSGADYGSVTADPVMVNLTDDDAKGVTVSKTSLTIDEDGGTDTYTVKLNSQPTGTVTVAVASDHTTVATVQPASLMFTASTWSTAQTVTVTGVDDQVDSDRSTTITHDVSGADYGSVSAASVSVALTDDDAKGVTVSKSQVTVDEDGGTDTYTVKLNSQPTGTVTVAVASDDTTVATVQPASLMFTASTWSTAQTVTVTGVDDQVDSDRSTTVTHSVSGADYGSVSAAAVSVSLTDDDAKGVTVSKTSLTIAEDGGTDTYTVKLNSQPTGMVTIQVASDDTSVATVSPGTLNFTTSNWSTAQTVTVTGVDDQVDSDRSTAVTHSVSDTDYGAVTADPVSVSLTDDDVAGVTVSESELTLAENGGQGTYTLVLDSQPTGAVTIRATSRDTNIATVQPAQLSFTSSTWNTAQMVMVTGIHDHVDSDRSTTVKHTVSGANYEGVTAASVAVTLIDDDEAMVGLSAQPTSLTEGDGATSIMVTATLQGGVTWPEDLALPLTFGGSAIRDTDYAVSGTESVTILTGQASGMTALTITPTQDSIDEGDSETIEIGTSATGFESTAAAEVTLTDDDQAMVVLSVQPTALAEGDSATTVTVAATLEGGTTLLENLVLPLTFGGSTIRDTDYAVSGPESVTILAGQASGMTALTITPTQDSIDEGDSETIEIGTSATGFESTAAAEVTLTDDDSSGVMVAPTDLQIAEGSSGNYTMVLTSQPLDRVTITSSHSGDVDLSVDKSSLIFLPSTWSQAQTVTVSAAQDDDAVEGIALFTHTAASTDTLYNDIPIDEVETIEEEDETVGVTVTPSKLSVAEGGSGSYTAVLTSQPSAIVIITLSHSGDVDLSVDKSSLTFLPNTWNQAQTVTVSAAQDDDAVEGSALFTHTSTSTDTNYSGLTIDSVTVTEKESEAVGVTVTPTDLIVAEGGSGAYSVALTSQPLANVAILISHSGDADLAADKSTLNFLPNTWNQAQTVTVSANQDDDTMDGTATLTHTSVSADTTYNNILINDVTATEDDDDTAGVTISPTELSVAEAGGQGTYTVVLTSQPAGTVSIRIESADTTTATVSPSAMTFLPNIWNQAQTVVVTGVDNDIDSNRSTTVRHTVTGADYDGVAAPDVTVTLVDDDAAATQATLSVSDSTFTESEGSSAVTVTAVLDQAVSTSVTMTLSLGGTAREGANGDYTLTGERSITIPAGTAQGTTTLTLSLRNDALVEESETIVIRGNLGSAEVTPVTLTIHDDDESLGTVTLTVNQSEVNESDGPTLITLTARLPADLRFPEIKTVTITVSGTGIATAVDFEPVQSFTINFLSNTGTTSGSFRLIPENDAVDEDDEVIEISGVTSQLRIEPTTIDLIDDDQTPESISLDIDEEAIAEGEGSTRTTVTARVDGGTAFATNTTISLSLGGSASEGEDADFTMTGSRSITIPAGQRSGITHLTFPPSGR